MSHFGSSFCTQGRHFALTARQGTLPFVRVRRTPLRLRALGLFVDVVLVIFRASHSPIYQDRCITLLVMRPPEREVPISRPVHLFH